MWLMLIGNEASGVYESEDGTTCPHFLRLLCYSRNPVPLLILNLYRPDGDPKRFGAPRDCRLAQTLVVLSHNLAERQFTCLGLIL